jgi:hypothetical protein
MTRFMYAWAAAFMCTACGGGGRNSSAQDGASESDASAVDAVVDVPCEAQVVLHALPCTGLGCERRPAPASSR